MPPVTQEALLYTTELDVQAAISVNAELLWLDDDNSGTLSPTEQNYLLINGINYATARCNMILGGRYNFPDLATSWMVNDWCTRLAVYWMCGRRGNPVPGSVQKAYDEANKDMMEINRSHMNLNDIGTRNPEFPAWSNVAVLQEYQFKKIRVETQISDGQPVSFPQFVDWSGVFYYEL